MFTSEAQTIIDRAKDMAFSVGDQQLTLGATGCALAADREGQRLLAVVLGIDRLEVGRLFPPPGEVQRCLTKLPLAPEVRQMLGLAKRLVPKAPLRGSAALIALPHLVGAVVLSLPRERLGELPLPSERQVLELLAVWEEEASKPPTLGVLTRRLRVLREELLRRIHGQNQAVRVFVDGLFNVEVVREVDKDRKKPAGLFLFAGPPGVGKTYLAELAAVHLDRPFKRFDMSGFSQEHQVSSLIGAAPMYKGAQKGELTEFVQRNPNALLLFDEVEKAHYTAIHLFLQLLDAGRLQDKFTDETIEFCDTIILFTTNAGRSLYDNENASGVHQANSAFHRATLLDALRSEIDPRSRAPFFPEAICSRLATGYPILFNHLRVPELASIAGGELGRIGALLQLRYGQRYAVGEEIAVALVMREGARTDARTVKAQAEAFLKQEVFKACQLFADDRIDAAFSKVEDIVVEVDSEDAGEVVTRLFRSHARPTVLFIGEPFLGRVLTDAAPEVAWLQAMTVDETFERIAKNEIDFVLLELAIRASSPRTYENTAAAFQDVSEIQAGEQTMRAFDYRPLAARRYAAGQKLLEQLHLRSPEVPVYLSGVQRDCRTVAAPEIDEELLQACVQAGGARGIMGVGLRADDVARLRKVLGVEIAAIARRLRLERVAQEAARQSQVVAFDTAPLLERGGRSMRLRCRNFRLVRAPRSEDVGAVLSGVERPTTRFDDVIGARSAKEAVGHVRDWLREPKRYAIAGLDPPKGVLLTGPPGTGKTMLARALAGESECAFITEAATNFVTMWQGSGPENVRQLFKRARRYAPSIVFIDEVDAIGRRRSGQSGTGHGEEMALNALLTEMDGFAGPGAKPVIVLAATNLAETLDPALLRRFSRVIELELPTRAERELYLRHRLETKGQTGVSPQMIERLAAQGHGMSIANLEQVVAHALAVAFEAGSPISDDMLSEAFEGATMGAVKPGGDPLRTARHEAGHALIMCLTAKPPIYVTIVGRGSFGGYTAFEDVEERRSRTKAELGDLICQILAGREAERLYYDQGYGESTGPVSDLQQATTIAESMVYDFGMADEVGFIRIDRSRPLSGELVDRCHKAVRRVLEEQSKRAGKLLVEHRASLVDRI